ncbi:hypothetical protein ACWFQ8_03235 [Streptomyces sp. NPDC055254]
MNETEQLLEQVAEHVADRVRTSAPGRGSTLPAPLGAGEIARAEGILGHRAAAARRALHPRGSRRVRAGVRPAAAA